jgi:2-polyprenyl-3-methyl-5-hydroxy-6-metoxy-1,4-benzoquinol methylase
MSPAPRADAEVQRRSAGDSTEELHAAAVAHADPKAGLRWIDVGCGTGHVLRTLRDAHAPARLVGVDVLPWLDDDLCDAVELHVGDAPALLPGLEPADRVLMVETIEHLEAPWTTLRAAARLVAPGGRLVVTTPHVATLRHRLELPLRGRLTSFRPHELQHLTPALPHVTEAILNAEGLRTARTYAQRDVIPGAGGRHWPRAVAGRFPSLLHISVVTIADRPR